MLPSSDELEELYGKAKVLSASLGRIGKAELHKQSIKDDLAGLARQWLGLSPRLRESGAVRSEMLADLDGSMSELLVSSTQRARASALKSKLAPIVDGLIDDVIVPIIQLEGSPRQVAGRQVKDAFDGAVSPEESAYLAEAARCVTVESYRAAIIMLWAGGMARMHAAVMNKGFQAYNSAVGVLAQKSGAPFNRIKASATISGLPELQRARDADVLIVGMELFAYDLQCYQELERLLGQRNDCAHPGMNSPGALDVQQFAVKLRRLLFDNVKP